MLFGILQHTVKIVILKNDYVNSKFNAQFNFWFNMKVAKYPIRFEVVFKNLILKNLILFKT